MTVSVELVKLLVSWHGGPDHLADVTGVPVREFCDWMKGRGDIPQDAALDALRNIGLPGGKVDRKRVHCWQIRENQVNRASILSTFFERRPQIARVTCRWSDTRLFAVTDGETRAVMSATWKGCIAATDLLSWADWKDGANIDVRLEAKGNRLNWSVGRPTMTDFDLTWNNGGEHWGLPELVAAMQEQGIDAVEAVRRLRLEAR